jgi:hypothetical protein
MLVYVNSSKAARRIREELEKIVSESQESSLMLSARSAVLGRGQPVAITQDWPWICLRLEFNYTSPGPCAPYGLLQFPTMEKASGYTAPSLKSKKRVKPIQFALLLLAVFSYSLTYLLWSDTRTETLPINAAAIVAQCRALYLTPGPPDNFHSRTESDRFQEGTKPTLIRNATIWTGQDNGNVVIRGDILIDKGLIKKVGSIDESVLRSYADIVVLDAAGSWVSPG